MKNNEKKKQSILQTLWGRIRISGKETKNQSCRCNNTTQLKSCCSPSVSIPMSLMEDSDKE